MCFKPHLNAIQSHIIITCTVRMMSWGWVKQEDEEDNNPVRSRADYVKSGSRHTNKKEEWGGKNIK